MLLVLVYMIPLQNRNINANDDPKHQMRLLIHHLVSAHFYRTEEWPAR